MNLDLGKWSTNANSDIANLPGQTGDLAAHLTVKGPGNGESDWFKFTVAAGSKASFDIDHGFDYGDPIVWLSLLRIYDATGTLLAQGPGFSDPLAAGAGGSSTWLDDYLSTRSTRAASTTSR